MESLDVEVFCSMLEHELVIAIVFVKLVEEVPLVALE